MAFIDDHREEYGVEPICAVLPIAPSTYFQRKVWEAHPERRSRRAQEDERLRVEIQRVWDENWAVYGVEKVWEQMNREAIPVARCRVSRLMKDMGLRGAVRGRAFKITTIADENAARPTDLVERNFTATRPNELWVSDLTFVATWRGFVYVAFVIDVFARRIVGWRVSSSLRSDLALDALEQFYEIRRNLQTYGADGLIDRLPGAKGPHPNRVNEEVENALLDHALEQPTRGPQRVADELMLKGIQVSSTGVRGVWIRHGLTTKHLRLLRLEETSRKRKLKLTDAQVRALERFDPEFRDRHIEVHDPGELVAVDTFFVGTLKGVGKIYLQRVLDCFSRHVWGRLYTSKLPIRAVQVMNNEVLLLFDGQGVNIRTVLSDNGREFCGRPDQHPYELFLQLEAIEHRTTRVRRPQSNGFIERFHRTLLDEHLRIAGRTTWYETVEEMQKDLDGFLDTYNRKRPHRGRGMEGRTPFRVFKAGLKEAKKAEKAPPPKEEKKAA